MIADTILLSAELIVSGGTLGLVARQVRFNRKQNKLDTVFADDLVEVEEEREKPLIVVAPHYKQACYFVNSVGIDPRNQRAWVYAAEPSRLYGYRGNRCVFYGDWGSRKDAHELWDIARSQGFEIQEVASI